jgi:hypothetical protein
MLRVRSQEQRHIANLMITTIVPRALFSSVVVKVPFVDEVKFVDEEPLVLGGNTVVPFAIDRVIVDIDVAFTGSVVVLRAAVRVEVVKNDDEEEDTVLVACRCQRIVFQYVWSTSADVQLARQRRESAPSPSRANGTNGGKLTLASSNPPSCACASPRTLIPRARPSMTRCRRVAGRSDRKGRGEEESGRKDRGYSGRL